MMFSHELRTAVVEALKTVPEVQRVNHLEYWSEEIFFVVVDPNSDQAQEKAGAVVESLLKGLDRPNHSPVRLRFFGADQSLPSSATLFRRHAAAPAF